MNVLEFILSRTRRGRLHMTLIDPEKQDPPEAEIMARDAARAGTDAIMVGGSTGVSQNMLEITLEAVKKSYKGPVILFPASSQTVSSKADAIYFMSMLNSRLTRFIVGEQIGAAQAIKSAGIEVIPMGYVVIKPGMVVGEIGDAELFGEGDEEKIARFALLTEFYGMKLFYLESGSGSPIHAPPSLVKAARETIDLPIIVGGGIRAPGDARRILDAGADVVVTGSLVEKYKNGELAKVLGEMVAGIHSYGPAR